MFPLRVTIPTHNDLKLPKKYSNRVFHRDILEVLRELPAESLDMVYGDPDYNVGINYSGKTYTKRWNKYIDWYVELTRESVSYTHLRAHET